MFLAGLPVAVPTDALCWFDASQSDSLSIGGDGSVSAWRSRTGDDAIVARAHGSQRPRLAPVRGRGPRGALRFDGRNDVLLARGLDLRLPAWTAVAVVAPLAPGHGGIVSGVPLGGDDYDPGFVIDMFGSTGGFNYVSVEGAGRQGGRLNQRTRSTPFGAFAAVVVCRDETELRVYVDGALEGTRPVSPAETLVEELRLGARRYGGRDQEFLRAELAEFMLFDRVLSDEERQALERPRVASEAQRRRGEEYGLAEQRKAREERMVAPKVLRTWANGEDYVRSRERGEIEGGPPLPLRNLPVRTDLLEAIRLSMSCLNNSFDADHDGEPFFYSNCRVDGTGEFHHAIEVGVPHVVGRCLLGNMAASLATGIPFPEDGLAVLTRYARSSFDNPDQLNSYHDPNQGGKRGVEFHNMREGLYSLWALMHTPDAPWAREQAGRMLAKLDALTDETGRWSEARVRQLLGTDRLGGVSVPNAARMVDPLLAVHRLTGDPVALRLAGDYARAGLAEVYLPDGCFAPMDRSSGHVHSITSALSGITEYALMTGDAEMVDACKRVLDVGVPEYFSSWGWGDEVFPDHPADEIGRGEINQTGDVIRAALHLGAAGEPRFYELAERYLRSMLLPTQHREEDLRRFVRDQEQPPGDAERDVVRRSVGGYSMQLPNDRMREGDWPIQTQDITSGAIHAMAECWNHRVTWSADTASVNLLLDYESDRLAVRSELPLVGRIELTARADVTVRLRVPEWVDAGTLRVAVAGEARKVTVRGGYVGLGAMAAGQEAEIAFTVPWSLQRETVDGTGYTTTWAGNQIVDIRPRGTVSPLPF